MDKQTSVLFIHHSVGRQIIELGALREKLQRGGDGNELAITLWDHDYNRIGLSDDRGAKTGRAFPIPGDNTNPDGLRNLLCEMSNASVRDEILGFDCIAMKSCYPNNAIKSDDHVRELKHIYSELIEAAGRYPSKLFVILTSPPLVPKRTNVEEARRAREIADWLVGAAGGNVRVFDLFDTLAESSGPDAGTLRKVYRRWWPLDSHPATAGCETAAMLFVSYLVSQLAEFTSSSER